MNPVDAVRLQVRHYPGGPETLAVLLGKSPETLRKEVAGAPGYKLGVIDACAISEACIAAGSAHAHAYANAVALNCGGFVQLQVRDDMRPRRGAIHLDAAALVKEASDVLSAVADGMRDGVLSTNERKAIARELRELLAQVQVVDLDVEQQLDRQEVPAM